MPTEINGLINILAIKKKKKNTYLLSKNHVCPRIRELDLWIRECDHNCMKYNPKNKKNYFKLKTMHFLSNKYVVREEGHNFFTRIKIIQRYNVNELSWTEGDESSQIELTHIHRLVRMIHWEINCTKTA